MIGRPRRLAFFLSFEAAAERLLELETDGHAQRDRHGIADLPSDLHAYRPLVASGTLIDAARSVMARSSVGCRRPSGLEELGADGHRRLVDADVPSRRPSRPVLMPAGQQIVRQVEAVSSRESKRILERQSV